MITAEQPHSVAQAGFSEAPGSAYALVSNQCLWLENKSMNSCRTSGVATQDVCLSPAS